jgi:hypothetical protein
MPTDETSPKSSIVKVGINICSAETYVYMFFFIATAVRQIKVLKGAMLYIGVEFWIWQSYHVALWGQLFMCRFVCPVDLLKNVAVRCDRWEFVWDRYRSPSSWQRENWTLKLTGLILSGILLRLFVLQATSSHGRWRRCRRVFCTAIHLKCWFLVFPWENERCRVDQCTDQPNAASGILTII